MELQQVIRNLPVIDSSPSSGSDLRGEVRSICYDSRVCGVDSLFVAVPGLVHDGHDFIDGALERGARYVIHEKEQSLPAGIVSLRVSDSRSALAHAAKNFYQNPSDELIVLGITGTNGKTTITYLLESVLRAAGYKAGVIGTVNCRYDDRIVPSLNTTPESLDLQRILRDMADAGTTHVVMEVSSHAIDMKRILGVQFRTGVFTNLSEEHLDYHRTMENYYSVKKRFFLESLEGKPAVVNGDDSWGRRLADEIDGPVVVFGTSESCSVRVLSCDLTLQGMNIVIETPRGTLSVMSSLAGRFNLSNILATVGAAIVLNIEDRFIVEGIAALPAIPGRLERVPGADDIHVFVDYAHTGDALRNVLETLGRYERNRLITLFGCGGDRDRTKRPIMGRTATELSDCAVITSDNPRGEDPAKIIEDIEAGINRSRFRKAGTGGNFQPGEYRVIEDRESAIHWAIEAALPGDVILIAGKGHEDYQIIGTRRTPFDDRTVAAEALALRRARSES